MVTGYARWPYAGHHPSYGEVTYPDPKELTPCNDKACMIELYFFYKDRAKTAYRIRNEVWTNYKLAWAKNDQPAMDEAYTNYLEMDMIARKMARFVVAIDDEHEQRSKRHAYRRSA